MNPGGSSSGVSSASDQRVPMRGHPISCAARRLVVKTTVPITPPASAAHNVTTSILLAAPAGTASRRNVSHRRPNRTRSVSLRRPRLLHVLDRDRSVHEREVRQPLREVAEELLRLWIHLLGEQPDVVRQRDELLHQLDRLVEPAVAGERVDEPERTREERALLPLQAVLSAIPVHEWPDGELAA